MSIKQYIYTVVCTLNSLLLSGHLGVIAGTLRRFIFPVRYGSVGVQLTRLPRLSQGTIPSECVRKNLYETVLQVTCTMQQSSRGGKRVHKTVHIYCSVYPQLPPVIGAPRVCCVHASGITFPRLLWFSRCKTHVTPCSVPGYYYFTMWSEKYEHNCLTSYWCNVAILTRLFFIHVFKEVLSSEFVE